MMVNALASAATIPVNIIRATEPNHADVFVHMRQAAGRIGIHCSWVSPRRRRSMVWYVLKAKSLLLHRVYLG